MSVKAERLKGYLLEEALVYLLRNAGLRLLADPRQAPEDLEWRGSALTVRGRGAAHQVDVLGDMAWVPAFAFPVRLWLEAKFRAGRAGIEEVRNAVGVLGDVNDDGGYARGQRPEPRHRYVYALFSAAGFTRPAAELALAHRISLVDLSGGEYAPLLDAVEAAADADAFRLSFRLPDPFAQYLLAGEQASLAVYRFDGGRDQIFRLEFDAGRGPDERSRADRCQ